MSRRFATVSGVVLTLLVACGGEQNDQEAGIEELNLVQEWVIDGHANNLVSVFWMAAAEDGRLFVAQSLEAKLLVVSDEGQVIGSFGRSGEGPGEFLNLVYGGLRSDTLWVYDGRQRRVTFISPELNFLRTAPGVTGPIFLRSAEHAVEFEGVSFQAMTADGAIYASLTLRTAQPGFPLEPTLNRRGIVESDGTVRRLIATYDGGPSNYRIEMPNVIAGGRFPFPILPFMEISSDGSHYGQVLTSVEGPDAGTFQVISLDAEGDTVYSRRVPFDIVELPSVVADSVIDAAVTTMESRISGMGEPYRDLAWVPPMYPPVEDLVVGTDGSIWIRLRPRDEGTSRYLVLRPDGAPHGEATLPGDVRLMTASIREAWGVIVDELDVESVVKYSVAQGTR
ncbi:MAG: hypothetical protein WEG36_06005 [Gemmatimonadota bacterium]